MNLPHAEMITPLAAETGSMMRGDGGHAAGRAPGIYSPPRDVLVNTTFAVYPATPAADCGIVA